MKKNLLEASLVIGSLFCMGCCGYSTRSLLPTYLKTIHIAEVDNRTLRPLLAEDLHNQLITFFSRDGRLRVSPEVTSDLLLAISITSYNRTAATYDNNLEVSEWKYQLRYSGECTDQVKNKVLWEGSETAFELIDADVDEEEGIRELLEKTAELIMQNVLLAW